MRELNAVRYRTGARGHLESYFLKATDPAGERAIWIKATIYVPTNEPERPMAEGWAIAFDRRGGQHRNVAVKHTLPFGRAAFSTEGLGVSWRLGPGHDGAASGPKPQDNGSAERFELLPGKTSGAIATGPHRIGWELSYVGDTVPIVPFFHDAMYTARLPKTKLVTPMPDARFDGTIDVDGERWDLSGWRGMQGHNWGTAHADLYAWCHANQWNEDREFVLEGFSARVRVGPVLTPLVTVLCVRHRGVAYDFTQPLEIARAHGDVTLRRWDFAARSVHATVEGSVEALTHDMVGLYYPNPSGLMTYCLNSKLASARVRFTAHGRAPLALTTNAAALEIATHDEAHGVTMYV